MNLRSPQTDPRLAAALLLAATLACRPPVDTGDAAALPDATHADSALPPDPGEEVYGLRCAGCHGYNGITGYATDLPPVVSGMREARLESIVRAGSGAMPAVLFDSEEEVGLVVAYVLARWGD